MKRVTVVFKTDQRTLAEETLRYLGVPISGGFTDAKHSENGKLVELMRADGKGVIIMNSRDILMLIVEEV